MTPKANEARGESPKTKTKRDRAEEDLSQAEANELIDSMLRALDGLQTYLDEERLAVKRRAVSAKRLARLRLVHDDIASATKLSTKRLKD